MTPTISERLTKLAQDPKLSEIDMVLRIKQIVTEYEGKQKFTRPSSSIEELVEEQVQCFVNNEPMGTFIPSGFEGLDAIIYGFMPGEFVVLGGRPGMGKTSLLVQMAMFISEETPVLYFSYDNSKSVLTKKILANYFDISLKQLIRGDLALDQIEGIKSAKTRLSKHKLFFNESCSQSIESFRMLCEKHIAENGVKIIIIDYLQLMRAAQFRHQRDLELSYLCRELKNMAKELDVCVIASSQLSRAVETRGGDKRPMLSDLRESGAIEQDADKVVFLYRPEYYGFLDDLEGNSLIGVAELIVVKNRIGRLDTTTLMVNRDFTRFTAFEGVNNTFNFSNERMDELGISPPF
jgi:replicative DNA helicase